MPYFEATNGHNFVTLWDNFHHYLMSNVPLKNPKSVIIRESPNKKKSRSYGLFAVRGGGAQPYSMAFGGIFPDITEAILNDENRKKKYDFTPQK